MLQQGFDVDSSDYDNRSALMLAAGKGHLTAVKQLLVAGANPNMQASARARLGNRVALVMCEGGILALRNGSMAVRPGSRCGSC
jgi:ankyrin repeat protein